MIEELAGAYPYKKEGHFADIKENENFRRFNYQLSEKVYKEFLLYAIGLVG